MPTTETPAKDALLVKYLNEAYGKEKQLETNLQLLISRAENHKNIQKGLRDHLRVTKNQARGLQKRIKELGGKAEVASLPGPDVVSDAASGIANLGNRAVAAAKGPVQMLRGTGEADNMLRNLRDAYWNEAEEIAHYDVIEQVATALNDRETVKLAKTFRREEERMQTLLTREIAKLAKQVVREEVPASERRSNGGRRRASSSSSRSRGTSSSSGSRSKASSSRSKPASSSRAKTKATRSSSGGSSSAKRKSAAQKAAGTRTRKAAASSAKSTAKSARTTAKKAGTTAKKAGRAARSTAKSARS